MVDNKILMKKSTQVLIWLLILCYFLPVFVYSWMGTYSRALSDDYCDVERALRSGVLGGSYSLYFTYEGRFTANLFQTIIGSSHFFLIPYLPLIYCLLFIIGMYLGTAGVLRNSLKKRSNLISMLLTFALLGCYLLVMPNVFQSFYWANAAVDYFLPAVLLTFIYLITVKFYMNLSHDKTPSFSYYHILALFLVIIIGGLNEIAVVIEVVAFSLIIIELTLFYKQSNKKALIKFLSLCLIGSLIALVLVILAPGNAIRQVSNPESPALFDLIKIAVQDSFKLFSSIYSYPSKIVTLIALALIFGVAGALTTKNNSKQTNKSLIFLAIILILLNLAVILFASFLPVAYGLTESLPTRVLSLPVFVIVIAISLIGFLFGKLHGVKAFTGIDQKILQVYIALIFLFLLTIPIFNTYKTWRDGEPLRVYASQWDSMYSQIMVAVDRGDKDILVGRLVDWSGRNNINQDKDNWVNRCASSVFGINITTE